MTGFTQKYQETFASKTTLLCETVAVFLFGRQWYSFQSSNSHSLADTHL